MGAHTSFAAMGVLGATLEDHQLGYRVKTVKALIVSPDLIFQPAFNVELGIDEFLLLLVRRESIQSS